MVKPQTSPKSRPRVSKSINDNYCVLNVAGVKNYVHVSGKKQDLNPSTVANKSETVFLHVNSWGHGGRVVTLSPPTSEAGVRSPSRPYVGKLVVACRWSAVYSTEP